MKFSDFWFELPSALYDISQDILTKEEKENFQIIVSNCQVIQNI